MLTRPMRRLSPLCLIALLTACAADAPPPLPEVRLVRVPVPSPLLMPPSLPPLPARGVPLTQGRVGELLLGYDAALVACTAQLGAIARLDAADPGAPGASPTVRTAP